MELFEALVAMLVCYGTGYLVLPEVGVCAAVRGPGQQRGHGAGGQQQRVGVGELPAAQSAQVTSPKHPGYRASNFARVRFKL